jgi:5-formyltetrahydrofolate cyclo-ligase
LINSETKTLAKKNIRKKILSLRKRMSSKRVQENSLACREKFFRTFNTTVLKKVAGYSPIHSELNVMPILQKLDSAGVTCSLPVVDKYSRRLSFRNWRYGDNLILSEMGVFEPIGRKRECIPNVILTPLVAYDQFGSRLGYGGGFYDRTIDHIKQQFIYDPDDFLIIGIAYSMQKVEKLPCNDLDQKLDWIVTEKGAERFVYEKNIL